jgi:hypothetical protein
MPELTSDRLAMFVPLAKADATQRLVFGYFDETPDRAGEVCDYPTAKPAFEAWSAELAKASDGKSLGNIRGQHSNIAAGKLVELTFDDELMKIGFVAKIVDDNEWRKVEEGVYTGFSPGGKYAKRWQDGAHKRYTPLVRELSIVDVPCNPNATFTMVKADGEEEEVNFVLAKAYEPGNEATLERAETLAKAAGGQEKAKNYVVQARADLIAENAAEALAKMSGDPEDTEEDAREDPAAKLEAELAKAAAIVQGAPAPAVDAPTGPFADFAAAADALRLLKSDEPLLQKGLYSVRSLSDLLQQFSYLQSEICYEAKAEGDGSPQPAKAAEIVKAIGDLLVTMVQEEVAELIATMPDMEPAVLVDTGPVMVMELATSIVDLVKADTDLMEKAGARNSKSDAATIQAMHDGAVKLGATCEADANKDALAAVEADRDRLAKAFEGAIPKVEALTKSIETMQAEGTTIRDKLAAAESRIEELSKRAAPAKGVVIAIDKENDGPGSEAGGSIMEKIEALPAGPIRAAAIVASVGHSRG